MQPTGDDGGVSEIAAMLDAAPPAVLETVPPGLVATGRRRADLVRAALAGGVAVALVGVLFRHRALLDAGSSSVAGADLDWLLLAAVGTVGLWTAGTVSQLGSVARRLPLWPLFAVQMAATFANHLLPGGAGGLAINVRYLRRRGLSRADAVGAVALNTVAGAVTHTAVLLAALVAAPGALAAALHRGGPRRLEGPPSWLWVAAAAVPLGLALAWVARRWGARILADVRAQLAILYRVLRTPRRAAQLWSGSLAVPILHCLALYAVLRSLGGTEALAPVALAYLAAASVAALVPSPGGFGALDLALVGGLIAVGTPSPIAVATVLAYRLLTVWVPLLPGACVLAILVRRRVI
jgi:uncharacterized membrane protein YbhN (UPF0104 family)